MRGTVGYYITLCSLSFSLGTSGQLRADDDRGRQVFQEQRQEILLNLRHEISQLSKQCHDDGLLNAAQDLTSLSVDLTTQRTGDELPSAVQLPISRQLPDLEQAWRFRLKKLREDRAVEMYSLARKCLRNNQPSLAYNMIGDVLRLNPDHKYARAVLGQQLFVDRLRNDEPAYAGEWVSPFEASKRSGASPQVDHPSFGWIPVNHVAQYESGKRPWRGDWVTVQKEAGFRQRFENAWEIRSENFLVKTNTSLEEGVAISRRLERFHQWLKTNIAAFFDTPEALQKKFDQARVIRRSRGDKNQMEVYYFATRDEYNRRLKGKIPAGRVTNGVYWEPDKRCYFFRNADDPDQRTVFHEATHQILDLATREERLAAARVRRRVLRLPTTQYWRLCEKSNFWIIEGLASYFESFEINDGGVRVGDPNFIRFAGAKKRVLEDGFFIPLRTFCALGQEHFMSHPNVAQFYTQSSGVAHFLLHYKDGIYRDSLVKLLSEVYRPDLKNITQEPSLEKHSSAVFEVLDQQYRDHLSGL